jgi:hypothetical protein
MLFGGLASRLFDLSPWVKILPCPRGQWPTFLSFDVQPWNLDYAHIFICKIELCYQVTLIMWPTYLSFNVQLWILNYVHRLRCEVNFDISWPRFWQSVLLCCPLMYSHGILVMWNMTFTTKFSRLNCIDRFLLWSLIWITIELTTNLIIRIKELTLI